MTSSTVPEKVRARIREEAGNRCGYCQVPQEIIPAPLEIEHLIPRVLGGSNDADNLWLACRMCNLYKRDRIHARDPQTRRQVRLFNPREQRWSRHFRWSDDGTQVIGLPACGRATVEALNLNNQYAVTARRNWVKAGLFPPTE
ncbi:MAG: HNH endonuclease [Anaerolineae bacterium]